MFDDPVPRRAPPRGGIPHAYTLADTRLARLGFVSGDERAALARVPLTVRSIDARGAVLQEGDTPRSLYFLAEGWACRYATTRRGGRQITVLLMPGSVCNIDTLMFERADFGVRAITAATVLALPREQALALAARHPGVGRAFTWLAIAENAILSQWAVGLGRRSAHQRLAHFLCEVHVRLGGANSFDLPMTQEMIADALGLTSVHINRTMQRLRREGIVSQNGRIITVQDSHRLCALADFDRSYLDQIAHSAAAAPVPVG